MLSGTIRAMTSGTSPAFPAVAGRCPACGQTSLFLGEFKFVTCSWIERPDPVAASDLLS